jgi:hypothetical protein
MRRLSSPSKCIASTIKINMTGIQYLLGLFAVCAIITEMIFFG